MNDQKIANLALEVSQIVTRNAFSQAMMQNISFGANNTIHGIRNIVYGDDLVVFGDYQIVIGEKVTINAFESEADRDAQLKAHQDYLKMFERLDKDGLCPKSFFPRAKLALQMIMCTISSVGVKAKPEEPETRGPKIEEVVDEPTTMKK